MSSLDIKGRIHSYQSLGTVDGPGVRFVVFMQGCALRCGCCHNPDTWSATGGDTVSVSQVMEKVERYRSYFTNGGGITLSGGEPLLQASFAAALFAECRQKGIHTCLDTSGSVINEDVCCLLLQTDRILLDIKYTDPVLYRDHVGCDLEQVLSFLSLANRFKIPVTLRQVIVPTLNDNEENMVALRDIALQHACVDSVELLPFRKLCQTKYDALGIPFPFASYSEPSPDAMRRLEALLSF